MKKVVLFFVVFSSMVFFSFNFNPKSDCSTSNSGSRTITCGSCHGGSINTDIIITDGLEEGNEEGGGKYFNIEIVVQSNIPVSAVQANLNSYKKGKFYTALSNVKPLFVDSYGAQYALMDIQNSRGGNKEENPLIFQWYPPKSFSGTQNIIIEGVFANLDGTPDGDYSFYKEISIDVRVVEDAFKIYPTIVNDILIVEGLEDNVMVQILDFSGKNIFTQKLNNQKIELSRLPAGNYILRAGDKIGKFLKQ